jgi:hypothetical protein
LCTLGEGVLDCDQRLRMFVSRGFPGACTTTAGSPIEECSPVHEDDKKERGSRMYIAMAPAQICPHQAGYGRRQTGLRFCIVSNIVFCFRCARAELGGTRPVVCVRLGIVWPQVRLYVCYLVIIVFCLGYSRARLGRLVPARGARRNNGP